MELTGHTVLVVEDERLVRELVVEALQEEGIDIVEAATGDDALKAFMVHPEIEVVFTDITMPGTLNGFELAQEIRARRPDVSVLLTSGKALPKEWKIPDRVVFIPKPYLQRAVVKLIAKMFA